MANNDFVINNGVLEKYNGVGGNIIIPDDVLIIQKGAFADCEYIESITISKSVKEIQQFAFDSVGNFAIIDEKGGAGENYVKRNRTFSFIDVKLPDEKKEALQKIYATSVYDMGLSEKTSNSLWRFFICNIGQLLNFRSAADIKKIRNIGAKGAKEIAESLEQYGVCNDAWRTFLRK
ncbi:MAG: leucine-rich repeat protein [Clostridia bacterium]|nr:leucine-rich repeat protein [Clostridia bacterium]